MAGLPRMNCRMLAVISMRVNIGSRSSRPRSSLQEIRPLAAWLDEDSGAV